MVGHIAILQATDLSFEVEPINKKFCKSNKILFEVIVQSKNKAIQKSKKEQEKRVF